MHSETTFFSIFENVLGTTNNFRNRRKFFSSSAKYYFLRKVRYIQWNILNFELVSIKYFLRKTAGFCFLINLKFKKVSTSLLASLSLSKNKNSKASRLIVGPPSFQCYLSLSVWYVCFVYLHNFYQY